MRSTCDVLIQADVEKSMKDGIKWYISSNKVILTSGIDGALPVKYFKKAIVKGQVVVEDGVILVDLPKPKPLDYILVLDFEAQCIKDK